MRGMVMAATRVVESGCAALVVAALLSLSSPVSAAPANSASNQQNAQANTSAGAGMASASNTCPQPALDNGKAPQNPNAQGKACGQQGGNSR